MSFPLFFLFAIVFLTVSAMTHGTAQAFKKKRGGKGRNPPRKDASKGETPQGAEGKGLTRNWPKWSFPRAGNAVEKAFRWAEGNAQESSSHASAHAWDSARAVALLALGPEDQRVWAALSRSARSLADHAVNLESSVEGVRERRLRAAASVAMGALEGFDEIARAATKDAGGGPPEKRVAAAEINFARGTLEWINSAVPPERRAAFAPRAARSLAEALYPTDVPVLGRAGQKPIEELFPSAAELRDALARVEGPEGPGQGSELALSLKSRLGFELWDSGGEEEAREATDLLREASRGLDKLLGPGSLEAFAAKERLARRLAGLHGYGKIAPFPMRIPAAPELAAARELFLELRELIPQGAAGEPFAKRVQMGLAAAGIGRKAGGAARNAAWKAEFFYSAQAVIMKRAGRAEDGEFCDYGDDEGAARLGYDVAALTLRADLDCKDYELRSLALARRRNVLGGRHPETACSLALAGDFLRGEEGSVIFWALALEALEGRGGRYARQEADLKVRIGRFFMTEGDNRQAAVILAEADKLYLDRFGERNQERLACAALLAKARQSAGDASGAAEIYQSRLALLDGAPRRRDPEPTLPSDAFLLGVALAGTAAFMFSRGAREEASRLKERARGILAREGVGFSPGANAASLARSMRAIP
ncbi:MAG: hypothetical protein LBO66_11050 [Deltaproteobacteria bacterium]|jgi:hypothetical protein|nr:hypothetical protein [Deltaproteobacteria bacterium]